MTKPARIPPMLATPGQVPESGDWAFEFKWDGVRTVAYLDGGEVQLITRNDRDVSSSYPEVSALAEVSTHASVVLDGELIALDDRGRPSFGELQHRMHVARPTPELLRRVPVSYYVFDVLHVDGHSLLRERYVDRRARLEGLGLDDARTLRVPPHFVDADGRDLMTAARDGGLEGVVAKRTGSTYQPGRRSRDWVKVPLLSTQEVVVGGWKEGEGRRTGTIGSLLLGAYDDRGLRYVGHVGTGFSAAALHDLHDRLRPLHRPDSPFADEVPRDRARGAHWVTPELVGEVEYRQWTRDGRLRHASWRGLRIDKDPEDIVHP